nr:hypothetical protein [Candidatus Electrothrix aestuarii]
MKKGLRTKKGELIHDIDDACKKILELYYAVDDNNSEYQNIHKSIYIKRLEGVDRWYLPSTVDETTSPENYDEKIIGAAIIFAVSAALSGFASLLTSSVVAYLIKKEKNKLKDRAVAIMAAVTDAGKNAIKNNLNKLIREEQQINDTDPGKHSIPIIGNNGDLRTAYMFKLREGIATAMDAESKELNTTLKQMASKPEEEKWSMLQAWYNSINEAREYAKNFQYATTVEGWVRHVAHNQFGTEFKIGNMTLTELYREKKITLPKMQAISNCLKITGFERLPVHHQHYLSRIYGVKFKELEIESVTNCVSLADKKFLSISSSSIGVIEFNIIIRHPPERMNDFSSYIDSCTIDTGENKTHKITSQNYFLINQYKVSQFKVPKRVIITALRTPYRNAHVVLAFDEDNRMEIREDGAFLSQYALYRTYGRNAPRGLVNSNAFTTLGAFYVKTNILDCTLKELGLYSIG